MTCHWNREEAAYYDGDEPCRTDYDGNPTRHCAARRSCSTHIGPDEQTCPRCLSRARNDLRRIPLLTAMLLPVAATEGVNSPAAMLAGPAAQPADWTARQIARRAHLATWERMGRITEAQHWHAREVMDEADDRHPLNILGTWDMMIREDYGHPSSARVTVENAAAYLDRMLARIAHDPEQDFPLLAAELRKCRRHLEEAIALVARAQRGYPCPTCRDDAGREGPTPRLVRQYPHWCDDEDCCREHRADDSEDTWVCPTNPAHAWSHAWYTAHIEVRKGA